MALNEQPIDSPVDWVADHAREYIETDGEQGHMWRGAPTLALTTVGRKSGQPRRTMLIYGEDNGNPVVVASRGGAPTHPLWYLNMQEAPEVEVQIKAEQGRAIPRTRRDGRGTRSVVETDGPNLAFLRRLPDQDRPRDSSGRAGTSLRSVAVGNVLPAAYQANSMNMFLQTYLTVPYVHESKNDMIHP